MFFFCNYRVKRRNCVTGELFWCYKLHKRVILDNRTQIHCIVSSGTPLSLRKCKKNENVICLPTEHQGVHKNSFRNVRAFQDRIEIWQCWFLRREKTRRTRRKTSRSRVENQQQTQPTYDARKWNLRRIGGRQRYHHCAITSLLAFFFTNTYTLSKVFRCSSASIIFNAPVQESLKVWYICSKSGLCAVHLQVHLCLLSKWWRSVTFSSAYGSLDK